MTLRPPDPADAQRFVTWLADEEATHYLDGTNVTTSLEQEQEWYRTMSQSSTDVYWIIEAEGRPIGRTGIRQIDWRNRHGHTSTFIGDRSAWDKGYGTEAMELRTLYAFTHLNLHKLTTSTYMDNERSKRALTKAGYRQAGVQREHFWRDGQWHDHWLAELLRDEWEDLRRG